MAGCLLAGRKPLESGLRQQRSFVCMVARCSTRRDKQSRAKNGMGFSHPVHWGHGSGHGRGHSAAYLLIPGVLLDHLRGLRQITPGNSALAA